jgi:molecular chaperone GrpE
MQHQKRKNRKTHPRPHGEITGNEEVMRVGADAMIEDPAPAEKKKQKKDRPVEESMENIPAPEAENSTETGAENTAENVPAENAETAAPETAEPKSELETVREERDSYLDLARRERADFDNYRKRMQREMAEMKRASLAAFLKEFFGPLDDMDRVLQESAKNQSFDALVQGVRIMEENFWRALAKAGVKRIDAKGKQFDPAMHEAMAAVPMPDVAPNTVIEVYDNGYKLDDFILRPARVVVSRAPDAQ